MHSKPITLTANGETFQVQSHTTLPEFLASLQLACERVIVERNRAALTPGEVKNTVLADGDTLEIVNIVAGG